MLGLKEERQYLQNLEAAPSLSELAIDFRQRQYVKAEQLAELMFYQKKLLVRQQNMKSLTICIRHEAERVASSTRLIWIHRSGYHVLNGFLWSATDSIPT